MVVLIGILIAFQLNECSTSRAQKKLLDDHMHYISLEGEANLDRLEELLTHTQSQLGICDSLLGVISRSKDVNAARNLSVALLDLREADLQMDSYNVLQESGDIRYMEDFDAKRRVITLYEGLKNVSDVDEYLQNLHDAHYYPYLKEHFDLVNWGKVSNEQSEAYFSSEFGNVVSTYRFLTVSQIRVYKEQIESLKSYLKA